MKAKQIKEYKTSVKTKPVLKKLADQVIVITGATSGIGLATARMAAARGAKVAVAGRTEESLKELVQELTSKGQEAMYVQADVGKQEDVKKITESVFLAYGRFDTWVNNAGVTIFGEAMDVPIEDMKRLFDTDFWGVVYGSKEAAAHYKERERAGALINIGSLFGGTGATLQSIYSPAKFAVHSWTENIRNELVAANAPVSVTLVHPGRIDTPYNAHAGNYMDKQPAHVGMMYAPETAAEAILYAAEHPKRDMFVGGQAKALELIGNLMPRFYDKMAQSLLSRTQHLNREPDVRGANTLREPGGDLKETGDHAGTVRSTSLYLKASTSPFLMIGAGIGIGAIAAGTLLKK